MKHISHLFTWSLALLFAGLGLLLVRCHKETEAPQAQAEPYELSLPAGFPPMPIPANNALTQARVDLGKRLFLEPALSRDSSISCGSCHFASAGFADHQTVSLGIEGRRGFRNVPTLANIGYHPWFFKEGGSPTLAQQALGPIENHDEMDMNVAELVQRMKGNAYYDSLALYAYDRPMDLFVLTRALAAYQRTLISGDSPYDQFQQGNAAALSAEAQRGMALFFSDRTQCSSCHSGFDFSRYQMENNGLYADYADLGRYRVTLDSADIGKFKVPSLRNIAQTYPYMHDGSLADLPAVITHYVQGGKGHPNQSALIQPLDLTEAEQAELIAFLESLSDDDFLARE